MFQYQIISKPNFIFQENIIQDIFKNIAKNIQKTQNGLLNIVFVSGEEIQTLNKNYRQKDSVTDVLSFHYYDDFSSLKGEEIAGEMVFCEEKIISQGWEYGLWEEKEFYKLLIHSILHILWYDHEADDDYTIMQEFENKIWKELFEKND